MKKANSFFKIKVYTTCDKARTCNGYLHAKSYKLYYISNESLLNKLSFSIK